MFMDLLTHGVLKEELRIEIQGTFDLEYDGIKDFYLNVRHDVPASGEDINLRYATSSTKVKIVVVTMPTTCISQSKDT